MQMVGSGEPESIQKEDSDQLYRRMLACNAFQMDPGGSGRDLTGELCKGHLESAGKSQFALEEAAPSFINVIKTLPRASSGWTVQRVKRH